MDTLNNYLNKLFKSKVIKKSDFKKKFFLTDRQLNYFLKTGTPIPDNFLYLLSKNFNLSSEEFEKILEAYEVSKCGESIATNKKLIHKLLTNFNDFYHYSTLNKSKLNSFPECSYIPIELVEFLDDLMSQSTNLPYQILISTMQGKEVIELVQYIISKLYKHQNKHIKIEHIFNYKNIKEQPNMTHNLDFLSNITSLIASYENYNPYFYTITYTQEDSYNIYPNIILICNTLIYISEDFKSWFYINEHNNNNNINQITASYYAEFEKSKKHTKPFIRTMKDMASFQEFIAIIESTSMFEHGFRRDMSCLSPPPNMSIDWFDYDGNIGTKDMLKNLAKLHNDRTANFEKRLNKGFKISIVCSKSSTFDFLNTGRIYDQGQYPTFNINARITIISNLLKQLNNPSFSVHFIKEDMMQYFPFINKVQLCTNDGNIMISITDENSEICKKQPFVFSILLDSPEISNCFNEYIDTITNTMTYSRDESILIIKKDLDDFALKNNIKI